MSETQSTPLFTPKGNQLIAMYNDMADNGYDTARGPRVTSAYNDFELVKFRHAVAEKFSKFEVETVLDYGCGGSDWDNQMIFDGKSAKDFFGLEHVHRYEPARNIDERTNVDAVVCFDVMEHIFVSDVPSVLRDILSHASTLAIINVACYRANALLPNGENAHVTQRPPHWWKGMLDSITPEFPFVSVFLLCSTAYNQAAEFPVFSDVLRQADPSFEISY